MDRLPEIPGYQLQYRLGEGGMAKVYFGVQTRLKRRVAVKVMEGFLLKDENFSRRFLKEAETAANLNHPNIVTIYDVGQAGESYYMVMEYLDGTLKERIQRARDKGGAGLEAVEAVRVLESMAQALEYAHNQGYIHRDIKPDNIMFRNGDTPVLVDFGIAKAIGTTTKLTKTGMSIGTPHYMSPEQIRGQAVDGRADIYSLGVLFYEMLTGEVPYKATDYIAVVMKHLNEPVPQLPRGLERFQPLLERMMAKEKEQRIQSGSELLEQLRGKASIALEEPEAVEATMVSPVHDHAVKSRDFRAPEKRSGRRIAVLLVVFLAMATTALMVVLKPWKTANRTQPPMVPAEQQVAGSPQSAVDDKSDEGSSTREPGIVKTAGPESESPSDTPGPDQSKEGTADKQDQAPTMTVTETKSPQTIADPGKKARTSQPEPAGKDRTAPKSETTSRDSPTVTAKSPADGESGTATPVSRPIQPPSTVTMMRVPTEMARGYISSMDRVVVNELPRKIKVMGTMTLELSIETDGRLKVVKAMDSKVVIIPRVRAPLVKRLLLKKFNTMKLTPPKDRLGKSVRVEDWRLSYSVGTYAGRIILKRRL